VTEPDLLHLGRDFFHVAQDGKTFDPAAAVSLARALGQTKAWTDVLACPCAVVLGEMGSGKSVEFRLQVRSLREETAAAFFLPLNELAADSVDVALGYADTTLLDVWLRENGLGYFFLDSLDEAKLARRTLGQALKRLSIRLGPALARAHVIVSCRPSDWAPSSDTDAFGLLAVDCADAIEPLKPELFQLAPLSDKQVRLLAQREGITDIDNFMAAIATASALSFATRPLDVEWLARFWRDSGRLGGLTELVEHSIQVRLRDAHEPGRTTRLTPERAGEGARYLAGLASLAATRLVRIPKAPWVRIVAAPADAYSHGIDAHGLMSTWSDEDLGALLRLGLFDEATYGRVRLHHRSVQEYLAAEWLRGLLDEGLTRRSLDDLLFCVHGSRRIVRPHLAPVVAWLSLKDQALRDRVVALAPEVLIQHGDPNALTPEDRRALLRRYASQYDGRAHLYRHFDRVSLGRLAEASLVPTIRELLVDSPDELRATLMVIAREGGLIDLGPDALALAMAKESSPELRAAALGAVATLCTSEDQAAILTIPPAWLADDYVFGKYLRLVFPGLLGVSEFVNRLVDHSRSQPHPVTEVDAILLYELPDVLEGTTRRRVIDALLTQLEADDGDQLSWLIPFLAAVVARDVDESRDEASVPVVRAVEYFRRPSTLRNPMFHELDPVRTSLADRPGARRTLFWRDVAQAKACGRMPRRYWEVHASHQLYELGAEDISWLENDGNARSDVRERVLAYDAIACISLAPEDEHIRQESLERLASARDEFRLRAERRRNPPFVDGGSMRLYQRLNEARERRIARQDKAKRDALHAVLPQIAAGEHSQALTTLYDDGDIGGSRYGAISLKKIEERNSIAVAEAAEQGLRAFWKTVEPTRPERSDPAGTTSWQTKLALAGLELSAEAGELDDIDAQTALKAATFALSEMNSFPKWVEKLAKSWPSAVKSAVLPSLQYELEREGSDHPRVAEKVRLAGGSVACLVAPWIAEWLTCNEPPTVDALSTAVAIVAQEEPDRLAATVPERTARFTGDPERFAVWMSIWMLTDSAAATAFLRHGLAPLENDARQRCVVAWAASEQRAAIRARRQGLSFTANVATLRDLIASMFEQVPAWADAVHEGTYTPNSRDDAADFRDRLAQALGDATGSDVEGAYRELAEMAVMADRRDWLLMLAEAAASRNPACGPISAEEAKAWSESFTRTPTSADELHDVALQRLDDIKLFIEQGEKSYRELFTQTKKAVDESIAQLWLATQLLEHARQQYDVTREEEVGDRKRPDLRLRIPRLGSLCNIELKIADKWSYTELCDGLERQLVGQYLADDSSRHGVYVLFWVGSKMNWEPPDRSVDFMTLLKELSAQADEIVRTNPAVQRLDVVGIDFTKPGTPS